jgi:rhodanese-related sulfurtransferase
MNLPQMTPQQAQAAREANPDLQFLDVRQPEEFAAYHIAGAHLLPLDELPGRLGELDRNADILVICARGGRSAAAQALLHEEGFPKVTNLVGGMTAWLEADLPVNVSEADGAGLPRPGFFTRLRRLFGG